MRALDVFRQAYGTSRHNEAGRIADESGELLTLLNDLLRGYMAEGARSNRKFYGSRLTVHSCRLDTPAAPTVAQQGVAGATAWAYKVLAINALGERSMVSAATAIANGNAVLGAVNFNRVSWAAVDGAESYIVYRSTAGGAPASLGLVYEGEALTFDDTGIVATAYVLPVANETQAAWPRPSTAEMVVRLEAGAGVETSAPADIDEGTEIADIPFDQRHIEPGKPAVYSFGQVWWPAGRDGDPYTGPLTVMAAAAPDEIALITDDLPALWPLAHVALLKWELAIYLAQKDGERADEVVAFTAQKDASYKRYLAFIESESITEVRSYGHGGAFNSPSVKPR